MGPTPQIQEIRKCNGGECRTGISKWNGWAAMIWTEGPSGGFILIPETEVELNELVEWLRAECEESTEEGK
jgi:hypothetical protein